MRWEDFRRSDNVEDSRGDAAVVAVAAALACRGAAGLASARSSCSA